VEEAPSSVAFEAPNDVEEGEKGGDAEKTKEVEDEDKGEKDDEDDYASGNDEEEKEGDDGSEYTPDEEGSEGTINLADDAVAPDKPLDKVKPGQKVSSPFDLLIIAWTLLVMQGKKGKKIPDGDEESLLLLSNDEAEEATPLRSQKKKELATKLPAAGSSSKVGTAKSSEDVLMMIQGAQEEFFNLPWKSYVSVFVLFTFLFS